MPIAILAKDNADAKAGTEYGNRIGDGGLCLKFSGGTVSNATWKPDFDDSQWANATECTEESVNPKDVVLMAHASGSRPAIGSHQPASGTRGRLVIFNE